MRIELPMASVYSPRIKACRPICEICKHHNGFRTQGSKCESHSLCTACKCPTKQVSLITGVCPIGLFAGGRPIRFWDRVMKAGDHVRSGC